MDTYLITFVDNKCGRGNRAEPFTVEARRTDEIADAVLRHAYRFLASREVDCMWAPGPPIHGSIYVGGFRNVGDWIAEPVTPEATS